MAGRGRIWPSAVAGAALSILGNALLLGIPGALALLRATPIITWAYGIPAQEMFPAETAWPFVIFVTLAMGPLVPLAWWGTQRLGGFQRALAVTGGMVLGSVLVTLAVYAAWVGPMPA